jgi:cell division protein FtsB
MLDIQQKRKVRAVMYHRMTLGLLFIVVLFALHSTWSVYQKKRQSEEMKDLSMRNIEELRKRDEDLKSKIDKLATATGVEEEIRSKFSVTKGGENMVIVVPYKGDEVATSTTELSFWGKVKKFFVSN